VVGLDTDLFEQRDFGSWQNGISFIRKDIRDVQITDLAGFEAVLHLGDFQTTPWGLIARIGL